ncbi:hypothetical protein [Nocardiopsis sp. FR26]|uniref:3'-5' exonuclease n=1 Tax=Nocardiopsis sp. FR26 TaxID=2605987 RepID=UPI0013595EFE|nr:hypothetical protein [Nocardiopsis sp. FR26]
MTKLVFVDTETTGLNPRVHHPWEVAVIVETPGEELVEKRWFLPVDLTHADPKALEIGGFWDRYPQGTGIVKGRLGEPRVVACTLARILAGAVVVGSNPAFDQAMLTPLLAAHGQVWAAHYRMVDVITLGAGAMYADDAFPVIPGDPHALPFSTTRISEVFGINPDDYDRHTALGDCYWSKALFEAITKRGAE